MPEDKEISRLDPVITIVWFHLRVRDTSEEDNEPDEGGVINVKDWMCIVSLPEDPGYLSFHDRHRGTENDDVRKIERICDSSHLL